MVPPSNYTFLSIFSVFVAALGGSLHCVGMCGPFRLIIKGTNARIFYHLGRLVAYLALGFFAGALGLVVPIWISIGIFLSIMFLELANVKLFNTQRVLSTLAVNPFLLGLGSGILPCGLLHMWIGIAVLTQSYFKGALLMFLLWAGTLPALEFFSESIRLFTRPLQNRFPKAFPVLFLLVATLPFYWRIVIVGADHIKQTCHQVFVNN